MNTWQIKANGYQKKINKSKKNKYSHKKFALIELNLNAHKTYSLYSPYTILRYQQVIQFSFFIK